MICDAPVSGWYRSDEPERTLVIKICDLRRIIGKPGYIYR
jgi:hypothetical protein